MGIILGLDIGTQFCYAGYFENGQFKSAIRDLGEGYGIPTEVAYNYLSNESKYGFDATSNRGKQGWSLLPHGTSLKSIMRLSSDDDYDNIKFYIDDKELYLRNEMLGLLKYIAKIVRECMGSKFYQIELIRVGYPGCTNDSQEETATKKYCDRLPYEVAKAFFGENITELEAKNKVQAYAEGQYAADLIGRLFGKAGITDFPRCFCTIDVGAGTTDMSIMNYNVGTNRYEAKHYVATNFGGKNIDSVLTNPIDSNTPGPIRQNVDEYALIEHKKWIFSKGTDGKQITGVTWHEMDQLLVNRLLNSTFQSEFVNKVSNMLTTEITQACTIILMGGSCVIPWIKGKITEFKNGNFGDKIVKVERLTDLGSDYGVTNSNFLAMAAASYGDSSLPNKKANGTAVLSHMEVPSTGYSPFTYAVKMSNGDYLVIVEGGSVGQVLYGLQPESTHQTCGGVRCDFEPAEHIYRLVLKKSLKQKQKILAGEVESYVDSKEKLSSSDIISVNKVENSREKDYVRGVYFDYNGAHNGKQLHICPYEYNDALILLCMIKKINI